MLTQYLSSHPIGNNVSPAEARAATLAASQFLPGPIGDQLKFSMSIASGLWNNPERPHSHGGGHGHGAGCACHTCLGGGGSQIAGFTPGNNLEDYAGIPHRGGFSAGEYPGGVDSMLGSSNLLDQMAIPFNMLFGGSNNYFRPTMDYPQNWVG